jgi:hypothetical protein
MMPEEPSNMLDQARQDSMLSIGALWLRFFQLGGGHAIPYSDDDEQR